MTCPFPKNSTIDLHNDLLSYLAADRNRSPYDTMTRSAIPQLRAGAVSCLVTAVFAPTHSADLQKMMPPGMEASVLYPEMQHSHLQLKKQLQAFSLLLKQYPEVFCHLHERKENRIALVFAIENCSSFLSETEPLECALHRFRQTCHNVFPLYTSLTWNGENRLGGGTHSNKGLTDEGKAVLDFLQDFITAVDLSHASDQLATDILRYLDTTKSSLRVMASHAQLRTCTPAVRNLPDELITEIVTRNGIIGLTMIKSFIGPQASAWYDHVEYALRNGWENSLAIGADFFVSSHLPASLFPQFSEEHFFPELDNASCFLEVQDQVSQRFGQTMANKIFRENAWRLLQHHLEKWYPSIHIT
jgi:microsomal dipeptidase-like Zn-dependent dipeptidase